MVEGDINNLAAGTYQRETISNLYYSYTITAGY